MAVIRMMLSTGILLFLMSTGPSFADGFVFPEHFPEELRKQHKSAFTQTEILDAWHNTAMYFLEKADFANAIKSAKELEEYAVLFRQPKFEAGAYEVEGMVYEYIGQLSQAVNCHLKSLKIRERLGRKKPIALSLSHMGDIFSQLKSYDKAENYFRRSLQLFYSEGYEFEAAEVEYNLGILFQMKGNQIPALRIFRSSVMGFQKAEDQSSLAMAYSALGNTFINLKQLDSALLYHKRALEIREKAGLDIHTSLSYSDLCLLYLKRKEYKLARQYGEKARKLNADLQILEGLQADYGNLSEVEEVTGNYKNALRFLKLENSIRDSLNNQNIQEEIAQQSVSFEIQKQHYSDSIQKAETQKRAELRKKIEEDEKNRQVRIQYLGIFIFIMLLLGGTFLVKRISLPVIWLEGGIFFTALLLFEFLLLVLDPVVDLLSMGTPLYKFGINLMLGLLVFYAHSFLETRLKEKLLPAGPERANPEPKEESPA